MVGSLLYGADAAVAEFVKQQIPQMRNLEWGPHTAIGVVRRGKLAGGVVFFRFRGFDIEMAAAFVERGWALPETIRGLAAYPFEQLGVQRVTAITGRKNRKARAALRALGFVEEGKCIRGLDGREDAMILGLLREKCKWIKENGKRLISSPGS